MDNGLNGGIPLDLHLFGASYYASWKIISYKYFDLFKDFSFYSYTWDYVPKW